TVAAGTEHALVAAVAQEEGTLAVLHRRAQRQKKTSHNTPPHLRLAAIRKARRQIEDTGPGRVFPGERRAAVSAGRVSGHTSPIAAQGAAVEGWDPTTRAGDIRRGAGPVSRCLVRTEGLSARRPDCD